MKPERPFIAYDPIFLFGAGLGALVGSAFPSAAWGGFLRVIFGFGLIALAVLISWRTEKANAVATPEASADTESDTPATPASESDGDSLSSCPPQEPAV